MNPKIRNIGVRLGFALDLLTLFFRGRPTQPPQKPPAR